MYKLTTKEISSLYQNLFQIQQVAQEIVEQFKTTHFSDAVSLDNAEEVY